MAETFPTNSKMTSTHLYFVILTISVIVSGIVIYYFLFPPQHIEGNYYDFGNFTVSYTVRNIDNENIGIVRETDRLQVFMIITNKYPEDTLLYYHDTIAYSNSLEEYRPNPQPVFKNNSVNFTRIFALHNGINEIDSYFELDTLPQKSLYGGGIQNSMKELQNTSFQLTKVRAYTQAEYDGRFVLVSTMILAIATIGLVIINHLNVRETRKTSDVMKKSAELSIMPYLKGHLVMDGPIMTSFRISNVGNGPANNISSKFWLDTNPNDVRSWSNNLLMPNDHEEFFLFVPETKALVDIFYFKNNSSKIRMQATYYDMQGKKYSIDETIDATTYANDAINSQQRIRYEPLEEIAKEIGEIKSMMQTKQLREDSYRIFTNMRKPRKTKQIRKKHQSKNKK